MWGLRRYLLRQHNDANVLSLGTRVVGEGLALDMVNVFLSARFEGGRHAMRVEMIGAKTRPRQERAWPHCRHARPSSTTSPSFSTCANDRHLGRVRARPPDTVGGAHAGPIHRQATDCRLDPGRGLAGSRPHRCSRPNPFRRLCDTTCLRSRGVG